MKYITPNSVNSPKGHWNLIAVLDDAQERECALAIGRWDGEVRLAMRWNGHEENPVGNPQSRGLPTWFMVPEKYNEALLNSGTLSPDKLTLARTFIPAPTV